LAAASIFFSLVISSLYSRSIASLGSSFTFSVMFGLGFD
jgi:hypothetical protein